MFVDEDAQSPWDRKSNYGFRCVKLSAPPPPAAAARIVPPFRDFSKEKPVSDEVFRAFKGLYAYDKTRAERENRRNRDERGLDAGEDQFRRGLRRRARRRLPLSAEERGAAVPGGRLLSRRLGASSRTSSLARIRVSGTSFPRAAGLCSSRSTRALTNGETVSNPTIPSRPPSGGTT